MKYLITTTDNKYFQWQLLVQYNNFKKYGYEKDLIWVYSYENETSLSMFKLMSTLGIKGYGILDDRKKRDYASSIRPYILSKIFKQVPELEDEVIFYADPDMLFNSKFSTAKLLENKTWYVSDTKSYLNSHYIKNKGEKLFQEMCDIVGIDPDIVTKNDDSAGGAQYIMKGLTSEFWEKVYLDSEKLYTHMIDTSDVYTPTHPIQAWTADMWAVLWNAWYFKHKTKIIKRMDFSWATDTIDKINKRCIYHNAGVMDENDLFNKGHFANKYPFNEDFSFVDDNRGSYYYTQEILDTKNNYTKLINSL
jgi:hypothetical protein